jgi:hypothetical protein
VLHWIHGTEKCASELEAGIESVTLRRFDRGDAQLQLAEECVDFCCVCSLIHDGEKHLATLLIGRLPSLLELPSFAL